MAGNADQSRSVPLSPRSAREEAGDDRIRLLTCIVSIILVPFLLVAFIILWAFPYNGVSSNGVPLWAWLVYPTMAPMIMGAGYIAGAYFFVRLIVGGRWHWFTHGFPAITVFVWDMGLATFLHWGPFLQGRPAFYAWTILYVVTPFLVPLVWYLNLPADPHALSSGDVVVPEKVRSVVRAISMMMAALVLFMFILPGPVIAVWPWRLVPLSARTLAGWFALPAVMGLFLSSDPRWSSWRILLQSQMLAFVLMLVGVVRAWDSFSPANPATWLFVGSLAVMFLGILGLYGGMEMRRRGLNGGR